MERVINAISIGKANAISMTALAAKLNVSITTVKKLVREARQQGYQIVSGNEGYWITEDDRDKKAFVVEMQKQALSRISSSKHIKESLEDFEGQQYLFDKTDGE